MSDTDFAVVITNDNALQKITKEGPGAILTSPNMAMDVSVASDNNIWIVTQHPDYTDEGGGSKLLFSADDGKTFKAPLGKPIGGKRVAGTKDGHCWFISEDNAVYSMNFAGESEQIMPPESALQIAIDALDRVWIVSTQINEALGGNIVMETSVLEKAPKNIPGDPVASKITGWQDGSCWIVTPKGEVGFIELSGSTGLLSPAGENIALDIGISPNGGTAWIVGTDLVEHDGVYGNSIHYWDEMGSKTADWKIVPGAHGTSVSGGN